MKTIEYWLDEESGDELDIEDIEGLIAA